MSNNAINTDGERWEIKGGRMRKIAALLVVTLFWDADVHAGDMSAAFSSALRALEAQKKTSDTKQYGAEISRAIDDLKLYERSECTNAEEGAVHVIVRIESGGIVGEVVGAPEGPKTNCYRSILLGVTFPPPPIVPYYSQWLLRGPRSAGLESSDEGASTSMVVALLVGKDGRVKDGRIVESSGYPRLDEAALLEAKRSWKLEPVKMNGKVVEAWGQFRVKISLDEAGSIADAP